MYFNTKSTSDQATKQVLNRAHSVRRAACSPVGKSQRNKPFPFLLSLTKKYLLHLLFLRAIAVFLSNVICNKFILVEKPVLSTWCDDLLYLSFLDYCSQLYIGINKRNKYQIDTILLYIVIWNQLFSLRLKLSLCIPFICNSDYICGQKFLHSFLINILCKVASIRFQIISSILLQFFQRIRYENSKSKSAAIIHLKQLSDVRFNNLL